MQSFKHQVTTLLKLATPIFLGQISQTLMGFVDTIMAGQVSPTDLAAIAVANSIWFPLVLLVLGVLMALTPIISFHHGADREGEIACDMQQALWVGLLVAVAVVGMAQAAPLILEQMDIEPKLASLTIEYISYVIWGIPAFTLFHVLKNTSEGVSLTKPSMWIGFLGLLTNIPANYAFIYGKWGAPAMGGAGCGAATAIVMWVTALTLAAYMYFSKQYSRYRLFETFYAPYPKQMAHIFRLGFPMAIALFFEVTLFAVVSVLIAPLGAIQVSGHQVTMNITGIIFMAPLSLGIAVTILMSHSLGADKPADAFRVLSTSLKVGLGYAFVMALMIFLFRHQIPTIYTNDQRVIDLAASLLLIAMMFQFADILQVIETSALRAFKDSKAIFIVSLVGYWGVGLTTGYVLGLTDYVVPAMGPAGFWIGFNAGLSAAAILYSIKLRRWYRHYFPKPQQG